MHVGFTQVIEDGQMCVCISRENVGLYRKVYGEQYGLDCGHLCNKL